MRKQLIRLGVILMLGALVGGAMYWHFLGRPENRLVGKWQLASDRYRASNQIEGWESEKIDPSEVRGIELLRGAKFVTFGEVRYGQEIIQHGDFQFVSSNRIEIMFVGFRTNLKGTNVDAKIAEILPPEMAAHLNRPKQFIVNRDFSRLTAVDYITTPATYVRER